MEEEMGNAIVEVEESFEGDAGEAEDRERYLVWRCRGRTKSACKGRGQSTGPLYVWVSSLGFVLPSSSPCTIRLCAPIGFQHHARSV